ncbi:MAG: hypothetical protein ACI88H_000938 [Cocleimonas sp.]|jgi:hypothetical protein
MQLFLFTFVALLLAFVGMALGVILSNKELKGSCGGLSNIPGMKSDCSCSSPCEKRKAQMEKEQLSDSSSSNNEEIFGDYAKINIDKLRTGNK